MVLRNPYFPFYASSCRAINRFCSALADHSLSQGCRIHSISSLDARKMACLFHKGVAFIPLALLTRAKWHVSFTTPINMPPQRSVLAMCLGFFSPSTLLVDRNCLNLYWLLHRVIQLARYAFDPSRCCGPQNTFQSGQCPPLSTVLTIL